jgi:hypothetical protein
LSIRSPSSRISPAPIRPGGSIRPMIAAPVSDLPAPGFPDDAQHLAGRDRERHVVDRDQRAASRRKLDAEIADLQQRLAR